MEGRSVQVCPAGNAYDLHLNTNPLWLAGFASSAVQFAADFKYTYCVSNVEDDGLGTIGSREWEDYTAASTLHFALHQSGGLVVRSVGHRRYYGAVLQNKKEAVIYMQKDGQRTILGTAPYSYEEALGYELKFSAHKNQLSLSVNNETILTAEDDTYTCGGAGFVISRGTMTCDSLIISE